MWRIFTIIFIFVVLVLSITACQATPTENTIQSKNKDLVKEVLDANQEGNKEQLQEDKEVIKEQIEKVNRHLQMTIQPQDPLTQIIVAAEIIAPEEEMIPFVRLKPKNFTEEQLHTFANHMTNGSPLYYMFPEDDEAFFLTKEELEDIIPTLKCYLASGKLSEPNAKIVGYYLDDLEEGYKRAPSQSEDVPYVGGLTSIENNSKHSTVTDLKAYMGCNQSAWIAMSQSKNKTSSQMTYRNYDYGAGYNQIMPYEGVPARGMSMTYEEAKQMVLDAVDTLDGEDSNLVLVGSKIVYEDDGFRGFTKETSPQGYSFGFCRSYNGVMVKPVGILWGSEGINYRQEVRPEALSFVIDDRGFVSCYWTGHSQYVETITTDVPLMPFDDVKAIFEKQCKYQFAYRPKYDTYSIEGAINVNVKRVEMNLMVTAEKDNAETYLVVPVWDFIADLEYEETIITHEGFEVEAPQNVSIVTINAIDGTVINREQGY